MELRQNDRIQTSYLKMSFKPQPTMIELYLVPKPIIYKKHARVNNKHNWEHACQTPRGGLVGGDSVYVCTQCGMETLSPSRYKDGCPNPNGDVTCPKCYPHPKHPNGKCRFACWCKEDNEDCYKGGTPW